MPPPPPQSRFVPEAPAENRESETRATGGVGWNASGVSIINFCFIFFVRCKAIQFKQNACRPCRKCKNVGNPGIPHNARSTQTGISESGG